MKPIQLSISAWGPYKDLVEIDFERASAQGIFLITGPTGAGKTTVFDALTFALYGNVSGSVREKDSLRSDFAAADARTFVTLLFRHRGASYRVTRNPRYERPKLRSGGTTLERENAILYCGDELLCEGSQTVTEKITGILGLQYSQFKQIAMIAQGEFQELLTASSRERTQIFRNIFRTRIYDSIQNVLASRAKEMFADISRLKTQCDEVVQSVRSDDENWKTACSLKDKNYSALLRMAEEALAQDRRLLKNLDARTERLEASVRRLMLRTEAARELNLKIDRYHECCQKLAQLRQEAPRAKQARKQLDASSRFLKAKPAFEALNGARMRQKEAEASRLKAERTLTGLNGEFVKKQREQQRAPERAALLAQLEEKLRGQKLMDEKCLELMKREAELKQRQDVYLNLEEDAKRARHLYEEKETLFRRESAGILAAGLTEGQPCPVCGSIHHPSPARAAEGIPDQKELNRLKEQAKKREQELSAAYAQAAAANALVSGLKKEVGSHRADSLAAQIAKNEDRVEALKLRLARAEEAYTEVKLELEKQRSLTDSWQKAAAVAEKELAEADMLWKSCMEQCGFPSVTAYKNAEMEEEALIGLKEYIAGFDRELHAFTLQKRQLRDELKSLQKKDLDSLENSLKRTDALLKETRKQRDDINARVVSNRQAVRTLEDKLKQSERLMEAFGVLRDVERAANGYNPKKLIFEQYVLSVYFDDILTGANLRLTAMSNGRYELFRAQRALDLRSREGMELEVLDHYTGRKRSVKTLSGGETFKAALSLALGMSDVIQAYAGGIEIDALFIDEGFGALDAESMDQAVAALLSLVQKDSMIGIISHVDELKERIESQIEVVKTSAGSRIMQKTF